MRGELVAIDLETTGLNAKSDAIIEVGAARFKDGEIIDRYSTLVNPQRELPSFITQLTGIQPDELTDAPTIETVLPAIQTFVGDAPIIGHNVRFDTGFLYQQGILKHNPCIDTYELASVLMPRTPRYSLGSLTTEIGIDLGQAHRALDDACGAGLLYWYLWKKVLDLPYTILFEIVRAGDGHDWDARAVFEAALRERQSDAESQSSFEQFIADTFESFNGDHKPLGAYDAQKAIDPASVAAFFADDGYLAANLPNYEVRPQQAEMAQLIASSFNQSEHAMIEAGTGIGKSLAYLIPSVLWATQNNERVVVSTNTLNLQDQLLNQDIPVLQNILRIPFRASVLKGRSNYLCLPRMAVMRRRRPMNVDELRIFAKILVWLLESQSGDRNEISLRGSAEYAVWQTLSAEDEDCSVLRCEAEMQGRCPFYKARKNAESAHILIVNHALLFSDAVVENRVLPDYRYAVLDEAHHIEDAATSGLSYRLNEVAVRRRLAELGSVERGLLGDILQSTEQPLPAKEFSRLRGYVTNIADAVRALDVHLRNLFQTIGDFASEIGNLQPNDTAIQIRIVKKLRRHAGFERIREMWHILADFLSGVAEALQNLAELLRRAEKYRINHLHDFISSVTMLAHFLDELHRKFEAFVSGEDDNMIFWLNVGQFSDRLTVHAAPLRVGVMLEEHLWHKKESIILTSATLQTSSGFAYIRDRLYADHIKTIELGSPFNYRENTLVYVPNDIPEPNEKARYQKAVERGIVELAAALEGRVLALFTSYAQLQQTAQAITPRLALGNITVYDQSNGASREALIDSFKSTERAVLLGTRSFWEGVDVPGESLSALVIVRLPFAVPSEPIFAARSETYDNAFNNYAVPEAVLRFRQGFGRLIRSQSDRGIVTIFDRRVLTKKYGANFLEALPDCELQYGTLENLPNVALNWLK
ncbi:MAG: DEAD/DEAH box helicase [Chloroflexi bacterium]|nr:MAG: DEAD/DEAH box helicase [Chloroflexota bacterium]